MHTKPINLLPLSEVKRVHKEYMVRFGAVVIIALSILALVQIVLLLPSYYLLLNKNTRLKNTFEYMSRITAKDIQSTKVRISSLNKQSQFFATLATIPSARIAIEHVLTIARKGVVLKEITYTAPQKIKHTQKQPQVIISGVADNRRTLQSYQELLQSASFISSANLPVGVYAKNTNIKFTITLWGSFLP